MIILLTILATFKFTYNRYINAATGYKYEVLTNELTQYERQGLSITPQEQAKWVGR